ncbi:MAG: polysaccharide lyase family protein [Terracidiphilus sp.]
MRRRCFLQLSAVLLMGSALQLAHAQLSLTENSSTEWTATNGTITALFNPKAGEIYDIFLNAFSGDDLMDTTQTGGDGNPKGLYMDNDGTCMSAGIGSSATPTASFHLDSGHYLDWSISWAAESGCPFNISLHYVLFPNDPTIWTYYVTTYNSSFGAGNFGQVQYLDRVSWTYFYDTYEFNEGLNNLGGWALTLPANADINSTDTGRAVENAVVDLHGFTLPSSGWGREFYTKYDYSTYEYLHKAQCVYGSQFAACSIFPSTETNEGGPTKQNLAFTGNILMGELNSNHLDNELGYAPTKNGAIRIFGPIGYQFSEGNSAATAYNDAVNSISGALTNFAGDSILVSAGYIPNGSGRGTVSPTISGGGSSSANTAWAVLGDSGKNMQYSTLGYQYWTSLNSSGSGTMSNVIPGTYRLSAYVLGEWGQLRDDGIVVTANGTTSPNLVFKPENFSPSGDSPVWTIGTPTRSSNKFLHGSNTTGNAGSCSGCDDREYWGNWNYWSDWSANSGSVVYYATAVGSTPATNNLQKWNYTQWNYFDPGLYDSSNDTTDNYEHEIPSYVAGLTGHTGTNGVTTPTPPWFVYFTTTAAQDAQGSFVDISIGLPCVESNLTASLNGHALTWDAINPSDCMVRSGLSGYYQWVVFEWPTSDLVAAGSKDTLELTVGSNAQEGVEYDALRMEISSTGANPSTTGWHDYEYVTSGTYVAANDAVSSNF